MTHEHGWRVRHTASNSPFKEDMGKKGQRDKRRSGEDSEEEESFCSVSSSLIWHSDFQGCGLKKLKRASLHYQACDIYPRQLRRFHSICVFWPWAGTCVCVRAPQSTCVLPCVCACVRLILSWVPDHMRGNVELEQLSGWQLAEHQHHQHLTQLKTGYVCVCGLMSAPILVHVWPRVSTQKNLESKLKSKYWNVGHFNINKPVVIWSSSSLVCFPVGATWLDLAGNLLICLTDPYWHGNVVLPAETKAQASGKWKTDSMREKKHCREENTSQLTCLSYELNRDKNTRPRVDAKDYVLSGIKCINIVRKCFLIWSWVRGETWVNKRKRVSEWSAQSQELRWICWTRDVGDQAARSRRAQKGSSDAVKEDMMLDVVTVEETRD